MYENLGKWKVFIFWGFSSPNSAPAPAPTHHHHHPKGIWKSSFCGFTTNANFSQLYTLIRINIDVKSSTLKILGVVTNPQTCKFLTHSSRVFVWFAYSCEYLYLTKECSCMLGFILPDRGVGQTPAVEFVHFLSRIPGCIIHIIESITLWRSVMS